MEYKVKAHKHYWQIFKNHTLIGDLFLTMHPTIPYEVFNKDGTKSKRVYTKQG